MSRAGVAPVSTLKGFPREAARDQATQNYPVSVNQKGNLSRQGIVRSTEIMAAF